MTAMTCTGFSCSNCRSAAVCTSSARMIQVDTALDVVVSICALRLSDIDRWKAEP